MVSSWRWQVRGVLFLLEISRYITYISRFDASEDQSGYNLSTSKQTAIMRFKKNPVRHDKRYRLYPHENLTNAYNAVKTDGVSVCRAAIRFGVPEQTLRDRIIGHIDFDCVTTGRSPVFSLDEEVKLYDHLKQVAELGYGYTRQEVTDIATDYAVQLGKRSINNPLTLNWFNSFRDRWPKITVIKPRALEYPRAKGASASAVNRYFDELETILDKYDLKDKPHLIYNVDEKGFMPNHKPPHVVATTDFHPQAVTSTKSHITTVIGAGSASGVAIPPFFIFAGVRMMPELMKDGTPGINGTMSATGWSNTEIFRQYLKTHFLKFLPHREPGQHLLLLVDGHVSHAAIDILQWAQSNNIVMFVLPAHTSHILQPLDVSCYGPLEVIYDNICHKFSRSSKSFITRYDMCGIVCKAYSKAVTPENLYAGFRKAGIHPLDRTVIRPEYVAPATILITDDDDVNDDNACIPTEQPTTNDDKETENEEMQVPVDDHDDATDGDLETRDVVESHNNIIQSPGSFLSKKLDQIKSVKSEKKKRKPRKCISKIISGKAVTEKDVMEKIVEYNAKSKSVKSEKAVRINKPGGGKKKATGKCNSATTCEMSPQPGPSHFYVSDSSQSISDDDVSDAEKCCVCHLFTPKEIRESNYLQFTQWVQCDTCDHWVHLKFCTEKRVVRRGDTFKCIHCQMSEE